MNLTPLYKDDGNKNNCYKNDIAEQTQAFSLKRPCIEQIVFIIWSYDPVLRQLIR